MRRKAVLSLVGAAGLAAAILGGGSAQTLSREALPQSSLSAAAEPPSPSVEHRPLQEAAASPPVHIDYPAVEMDQAVLPLSLTEQEASLGSLVPPPTPDAYWLTPYGTPGPGSTNTTYIVGHSWEGRPSPFNGISSRAQPGDRLTVSTAQGPLVFTVDEITTEYKDTLRDSAIWDRVPGRFVLITCFTEDLWGTNIIIQASPLPSD
ncbi:class F sortase [Pseudarthrobacter oxydans]|uniref:class F sortase n=1 Tax=Pseudarthrobacter oxydans TaxID=1671 RepID=UPI002AA68165|nr:class F sortase [Pseudarthrobacter oxydans]WPU09002.1 class F sortase [Pseudarthrobacter oxydans]